MAHESFEDEQVAAYLNEHYIAVKVDREERPDIDHVYMMYCQAVTGEGGWPLTVVMTPDAHPFFAGTYFPKNARYGRPGLMDILQGLSERWATDRVKLEQASADVTNRLQPVFGGAPGKVDVEKAVREAVRRLTDRYDPHYGGFGDAPKFPTFHQLLFLLRYHRFTRENDALQMVRHTLDCMMRGGIVDQIGGGIARYSTDAYWRVPHFEKMLYDNALAVFTYTEAYQLTKDESYRRFVQQTLQFVSREMTSLEGAFFAAQDADSEGQEGRFYVWRPDDVSAALGEQDGETYSAFYDITEEGNFEGYNVPNYIDTDVEAFVHRLGMPEEAWWSWLREANETLYAWRAHRVRPGTDDKVLTAWNALMIASLARAGSVFQENDYTLQAVRAVQFIEASLVRREDGRLLARYRDGDAGILAYADDYAYLVFAYLELYQATLDTHYLVRAKHWQRELDKYFWDEEEDGYFLSGADGASLIAKPKTAYDGATPSANSMSAWNLVRLYAITGDAVYAERVDDLFAAFGELLEAAPTEHLFMMMALVQREVGNTEIVAVEGAHHHAIEAVLRRYAQTYLPEAVLLTPSARQGEESVYPPMDDALALYVCRNFQCDRPETDVDEALRQLAQTPPEFPSA